MYKLKNLVLLLLILGQVGCSVVKPQNPRVTSTAIATKTQSPPTATLEPTATLYLPEFLAEKDFESARVTAVVELEKLVAVYEVQETIVANAQAGTTRAKTNSSEVVLSPTECGTVSTLEAALLTYEIHTLTYGVPWDIAATMIVTESGFLAFVLENGVCKLRYNLGGAPAYCLGQIYLPAHQDENIQSLSDTRHCLKRSAQILAGRYNPVTQPDWILAVACYKGFCSKDYPVPTEASGFVDNFVTPYYTTAGVTDGDTGIWIPFNQADMQVLYDKYKNQIDTEK